MKILGSLYCFLSSALLILLLTSFTVAQNTCSQTLMKAQFTYFEGRAEEVYPMLEVCLKDGFTREEKQQAYKLLTLTYLYLNENANAEQSMLAFLQINPTYKINEAVDPAEFINLYKQFRTWPIYLTGAKTGFNATYTNILQPYSLDNVYTSHAGYKPALSYQVGTAVEIPLKYNFSAGAELYLTGRKFDYQNDLFGYEKLRLSEIQNRLDLPILLHYTLQGKKFRPYASAGITSSLLLKSQAQVRRTDNIEINEAQREISGPNITLTSQRRIFAFSGTLNLGVKYTRMKNTFILESRYNLGLHNQVKGKNRFTNPELIYKYGFIDNDIALSSFSLSLGYLIPVYKPKKITNKKSTQSNLTL